MKLEEHVIAGPSGEYSRKIWLLPAGNGRPEKIGIFLDGEYYLNQMEAPATLLRLQESGEIPLLLCVFVSQVNGEARHHDLTCNPRYSAFIAEDVVGWLCGKDGAIPEEGHLVAGPSLGGLAAAYLALTRPKLFSCCLSHSGSFWWRDEWLKNNLDSMPVSRGNFWLSVGDKEVESGVSHPPTGLRQDVTQVAACQQFATALKKRGHSVHDEIYAGGHEFKPWKEELPRALRWLIGKP